MGPSAGLEDGVLPPKGDCPAMTCSAGMRPDRLLQQGVVLTPTVPSQHFPYTTQHRAATPVCHRSSPAPCKFSTSLFQNQRKHLLPGIPKWQERKIVLGLLQTAKWFVCTSDPCGRRKGKDQKKIIGQRWGDRPLRDRREGDIAG